MYRYRKYFLMCLTLPLDPIKTPGDIQVTEYDVEVEAVENHAKRVVL